MTAAIRSALIFWQFLKREFYAKRKTFMDNAFNYALIYPLIFAIQSGFLASHANFSSPSKEFNTIFFAGNILIILLLFTYKQNIALLFDFENKRFIDYQITLLNPFLVLLQRIFFTGFYTFIIILPYYPMGGLLLPSYIDLSHTNWIQVTALLLAGSMCLSAYHLLAACTLKSSANIGSLWSRLNSVLINLGGFWVPLAIIKSYSPALGSIALFNPCIYITDGIKGAITGSADFIPFWLCIGALTGFCLLFTGLCWYQFKKRVDCL